MIDSLFETAPDFDQPIAVLTHCHDKIRKQLRTMQNLTVSMPQAEKRGFDIQQAANAVLRYFNKAAPHHHADEEVNLLPMLAGMAKGEDAAQLDAVIPEILDQHAQMDVAWKALKRQLESIASGASTGLSPDDVNRFAELYASHMHKEETQIAPMAKRLFSNVQMNELGNAMRTRRGLALPAGN
jgi:hemerythrin-like domain-containing protein